MRLVARCALNSPLDSSEAQIGKGEKLAAIIADMHEVAEGVPTILAGVKLAERLGLRLPLLEAIHAMVYTDVDPAKLLAQLMSRPVTEED
jgi:glycerol-3-phosphate dehydrogenase (NAD(P)+)